LFDLTRCTISWCYTASHDQIESGIKQMTVISITSGSSVAKNLYCWKSVLWEYLWKVAKLKILKSCSVIISVYDRGIVI